MLTGLMLMSILNLISADLPQLKCLDCHGDNSRMKWKELGFGADPMTDKKAAAKK